MDGLGNNIAHPTWGMTGADFLRSAPAVFGPQNAVPTPIEVPVGDEVFDPEGQGGQKIQMYRSQWAGLDAATGQPRYTNGFTSFIDCSGLYGNSDAEVAAMRAFRGGLLSSDLLPTGEFAPRNVGGDLNGHFKYPTDVISMMPHLAILYTVFLREHNRRARILAQRHPDWTDEMLFQRARRWVIAAVQKITAYFVRADHYVPDLTGQQMTPYAGYDPSVNPGMDLLFSNIAFRYGHSAINPLVLRVDDYGNQVEEGHLIFRDAFYKSICDEMVTYGIDSILRGFASQRDQVVDTHFADDIRSYLPLATLPMKFDLAAIGIQRELGIPDYNTCRNAWNLTAATQWDDITKDIEVQQILAGLYPNISDFDAYKVSSTAGAFAEEHTDRNSLIGPLMRLIVIDQFRRLRAGDRFWYENPGVLTAEELQELANFTLGSMVVANTAIRHFPSDAFVAVNASSLYFLQGAAATTAATAVATTGATGSVSVLGALRLSWSVRNADGAIDFVFESNASG
ncbi:hypothetical protein HK405_007311, partial [Cladochytrium tenue]